MPVCLCALPMQRNLCRKCWRRWKTSFSSWALNHHRAADRDMPTYFTGDAKKVEAMILIMAGQEDLFCSVKAAQKAHARLELAIFDGFRVKSDRKL